MDSFKCIKIGKGHVNFMLIWHGMTHVLIVMCAHHTPNTVCIAYVCARVWQITRVPICFMKSYANTWLTQLGSMIPHTKAYNCIDYKAGAFQHI